MISDSEEAAFGAPSKSPAFVQVWTPDGTVRRFAKGTKASFAIERINNRIEDRNISVDTIEAVKEGEESVEFGPDSELVSYGKGWRLHAIFHSRTSKAFRVSSDQESNGGPTSTPKKRKKSKGKQQDQQQPQAKRTQFNPADFYPGGVLPQGAPPQNSCLYITKVLVVFGILFAIAGCWVYFLESRLFTQ